MKLRQAINLAMYVLLQYWFTANSYADDLLSDPVVLKFAKEQNISAKEMVSRVKKCADLTSIDSYQEQYFCANFAFATEDFKLNESYKNLLSNIKGSAAEAKLIESQRSWIAFRDAACRYETDGYSGGRIEYAVFTSCQTKRTEMRRYELEQYMRCTDPGCPGDW